MSKQKSAIANDWGVDDPKQVRLRAYLVTMFGTKKRCFNAACNQRWDWLEYSVKSDAGFCFPCDNLESKAGGSSRGVRCESAFTPDGNRNWKHATEMNKGFFKHGASKEHLACYSFWKKIKRSEMEISSIVNTEAMETNRYYFSTLIDVIVFWLLINWHSKEKLTHLIAKIKGKINPFKSV